jgi:transcriptional regulator with XRE-family HTH domain
LNRLKELRNEKNINQEVLAKLLCMEVAGYSKLETERVPLKDEYIIKLAEYFNVSTDYLLGKSDIRNPEKINIDDMDIAFATGIKGLNEENKEIAKNIIEGLLAKQENEEKKK